MTKNVLIIGATSGIAEAVARLYAAQNCRFFLVARNAEKLSVISKDLIARGARQIETFVMDANDLDKIAQMVREAWTHYQVVDVALVAHGTLPDQPKAETDLAYSTQEFRNNSESVINCLAALGEAFARQGQGTIAVIGSVAGDRGRGSNYLYGSAKAAVHAYASGLRARLFKKGVHVLTVKPGFVATAMTSHLELPARITASADQVAKDICESIAKRKNILYTPWFWRLIMMIICAIPTSLFKKISL